MFLPSPFGKWLIFRFHISRGSYLDEVLPIFGKIFEFYLVTQSL